MNATCEVIRDLLPLYHDGVCSNASKALVEEHLKECESCRQELNMMDAELASPHAKPESERSLKAASAAWKTGKKKSFIKGTIIAALVCALSAGCFWGLTQWKCVPVSADVLEVTELSQLPDGSVLFNLFVNDNKELYFVKYTTTDDGCLYFTPMHSILETTRKYDVGLFDSYHLFNPNGAETFEIYGAHPAENVTRAYVGPVGKGTLIWEEGMDLPKADADVERMLNMT